MTNEASRLTRSVCLHCGRSYPHKRGEKPSTCGNFDCLQAEISGKDRAAENAVIASNMRDYWKHLSHAD